jgi:hypothetical protein
MDSDQIEVLLNFCATRDAHVRSRRKALSMKRCKFFFRIVTESVTVPPDLQSHTRLPGDPQGDSKTGFGQFRRELLTTAMLDRAIGGHPVIEKVRPALSNR